MTPPTTNPTPKQGDPVADLSKAPLPTAKTLKRRRNLGFQSVRFVAFNRRILRMVAKGHQ